MVVLSKMFIREFPSPLCNISIVMVKPTRIHTLTEEMEALQFVLENELADLTVSTLKLNVKIKKLNVLEQVLLLNTI